MDLPRSVYSYVPGPIRRGAHAAVSAGHCFVEDDALTQAATLAFYTMFSFAPLLVLVATGLSWMVGDVLVEAMLLTAADRLTGPAGAEQAQTVLSSLGDAQTQGGLWSIGLLLLGATTALAQLQVALNRVWNVEPPRRGVVGWLIKRAVSLLMVLSLGAAAVGNVVLSGILHAVIRWEGPSWMEPALAQVRQTGPYLDIATSWVVFAVLFSLLFRFVPDTDVSWRDAARGGAATAALFVVGQQAIGFYLGTAAVGSLHGAAGSLAALLTWTFYSAAILLYGAEWTQASTARPDDEPLGATP